MSELFGDQTESGIQKEEPFGTQLEKPSAARQTNGKQTPATDKQNMFRVNRLITVA
jgi:hypothetical protein